MTRSSFSPLRTILFSVVGVLGFVAVGAVPLACQSGGVGDPCTPEDEYNSQFSGFKVTEENIESRSFQCETRICLVNHFQGRVSCPMGQQAPVSGNSNTTCGAGQELIKVPSLAPSCDPNAADKGVAACSGFGGVCNKAGKFCECNTDAECGGGNSFCECQNASCSSRVCTTYVCHKPGECQRAGASNDDNKGKDCCIPGTDTPVAQPVCGQCNKETNRDADDAVYCSCRCGVAEKEPEDPDFNFCDCPSGFTCQEIRKNVGLGDKQITGKYCIKEGSKFTSDTQCSRVDGALPAGASCKGIGGV